MNTSNKLDDENTDLKTETTTKVSENKNLGLYTNPKHSMRIAEKDFRVAEIGMYGFLSGRFYHYKNSIVTQYQGRTVIFVPIGEGRYRKHGGEDGLSYDIYGIVNGHLQMVQDFNNVEDKDKHDYLNTLNIQEKSLSKVKIRIFDQNGNLKPASDWVVE